MKNEESKSEQSRREFLEKVSLGMGGLAAAIISVPVVAAVLAPFLKKEKPAWRMVGSPDNFEVGKTTLVKFDNTDPKAWAGITGHSAAWLRREKKNKFVAFSINCTHLGCPVRWIPDAQLFMCPCHGGVYYKDGSKASGPPPRGLRQYKVKVAKGQVQILAEPIPISGLNA